LAGCGLLFAGQASQKVGMGAELYQSSGAARAVFDEADAALGFSISRICFDGPEGELTATENAQPALVTVELAMLAALVERGALDEGLSSVSCVAGHSLGEYAALSAAGCVSAPDAVRLVRLRGRLMAEAGAAVRGGMAAVLGLDRGVIEGLCDEHRGGGVLQVANLNCPGQVVISGDVDCLDAVEGPLTQAGAKRVVRLAVSGAFHSARMEPVREGLGEALAEAALSDPRIPVYANVSARPVASSDEVRGALVAQVASPVLWEDTLRGMIASGVGRFVEVGPGRVLSGLLRRTDKSVVVEAAEDLLAA